MASALSACSVAESSSHVLLLQQRTSDATLTSAIVGSLTLITDLCFGIETDDGTYSVVFPPGTQAQDDYVSIPGLGSFAIGDGLSTSGGFVPPELAGVEMPDECRTEEVVLLTPG